MSNRFPCNIAANFQSSMYIFNTQTSHLIVEPMKSLIYTNGSSFCLKKKKELTAREIKTKCK